MFALAYGSHAADDRRPFHWGLIVALVAAATLVNYASAQTYLPREMDRPSRSIIGAHHGILINDVHVRPAAYDEGSTPCPQGKCERAGGACEACPHAKCSEGKCAGGKCEGKKCSGEQCEAEKCTGGKCAAGKCADGDCAAGACKAAKGCKRAACEGAKCDGERCKGAHGEAKASCQDEPCESKCPACAATGECAGKKRGECNQGKCCRGEASTAASKPSSPGDETARAILEIMEALGHSVVAGTVLEPSQDGTWTSPLPAPRSHDETPFGARLEAGNNAPETLPAPLADRSEIHEALAKYIRALEAQQAAEVCDDESYIAPLDVPSYSSVEAGSTAVWVDDAPADHDPAHESKIQALRDTSTSLDAVAGHLESLDLYERADQIRGLAIELRHDARRLKQGHIVHARRHVTIETAPPVPPHDDAAAMRVLRQMREAMRHERGE